MGQPYQGGYKGKSGEFEGFLLIDRQGKGGMKQQKEENRRTDMNSDIDKMIPCHIIAIQKTIHSKGDIADRPFFQRSFKTGLHNSTNRKFGEF